MRILAVTHQYPPAIGGSEKYIADVSQELASRGHHVDVFTSRATNYHTWKSELGPRECVNGVNVYRFRSLRRTWLAWRLLAWSQSRYSRMRSRFYEALMLLGGGPICPGMFAALLSRVRQYDVVHLNGLVYSHSAYAYLAARWRHVPCVVTPHVEIEQETTYGLGYQLGILRGSDHVIADTEGERGFLLGLGVSPWCLTTAGCGLREAAYPPRDQHACRERLGLPQDAFVVLFVGRQVKYKGIEAVLEASALLQAHHRPVCIVVAGPETDYSRRLFARWRGRPGVVNLGQVSDDVRIDLLNACDCLAMPSSGEAFGIVYLEAWIVGKPVIGVDTPAVATVIENGVDGWLVPAGDSVALGEALSRWIEAPRLARRMGEQGRAKVLHRYTCARVVDVVEGVYLRTLRARHTRREDGSPDGLARTFLGRPFEQTAIHSHASERRES
jgi:glycosyltransferase involved in cell wall biosynthesis